MKNIDEKIKKIVALIDRAATEGEARAASLALQRLLVGAPEAPRCEQPQVGGHQSG